MELFLVQHGEAKRKAEDPDRPLTRRGAAAVEKMSDSAARSGLEVRQIVHSGKTRAKETAEIFARRLEPPEGVIIDERLEPTGDVKPVAVDLKEQGRSLMIVGHLPFLERLAGLLLVGDASASVVRFRNAGIVCLAQEGADWSLNWALTPDLVGFG